MKALRKFTLLIVAALCIGMMSSCAENKLQKVIEETNKAMPINVARNFKVVNMEDDGQYVVINYELNDQIYDLSQIKENTNKEAMQQQVQQMFAGNPFIDVIKESGRGLKFNYKAVPSGESFELTLEEGEF